MKKVLIIRFSSIGDIVLTTPIIRRLKQQLPGVELHFVTRDSFKNVLAHNPYIDRLYTFKNSVAELFDELKAQKYDAVIDLHRNIRTLRLKSVLKVKSYTFNKINFRKFVAVRFKAIGVLPHLHIVDRFFDAVAPLGITNDNMGLDYFINKAEEVNVMEHGLIAQGFIALVVGGSYYTKKIPLVKLQQICEMARLPIVLLGGKEDMEIATQLKTQFPGVMNGCGLFSVNQSASVIAQAAWVITSDTGMMHIAAAYHKRIVSVWGNTIPDFGMSPYLPHAENKIMEITHLDCRPCSKLGYKKCPRGHFKCMLNIDYSFVKELK